MRIRQQQAGKGLGSDILLTLVATDSLDWPAVFDNVWQLINEFEQRFSRFIVSSELTEFNQRAGTKTPVSPAFMRLLKTAIDMTERTGGLFNPCILPSLQRAGYVNSWPHPAQAIDSRLSYLTRSHPITSMPIRLGSETAHMPQDMALDFGGIGKGYLLDQLANHLQALEIEDYWLSIGGDIICQGHDLEDAEWTIGIQSILDPSTIAETIVNRTGARLGIATSGSIKRKGIQHGKRWNHLIDPRTELPTTSSIGSATVSAPSGTEADIFAKCLVLNEGSHDVLDGKFEYFLQYNDGRPSTLQQTQGALTC